MQNNWLHRILNYKATPPDGVWKDIANKLDAEENDSSDIAAKMNAFEATPPPSAFTAIFNELDKENDSEENLNSTEKLYHYAETPPAGAWENITAALDKNEAVVIPINSKKNNTKFIYRIAAAASLITIIIVTALLFIKKDTSEVSGVVVNTPKNNVTKPITETNNNTTNLPDTTAPDQKINAAVALHPIRKKTNSDLGIDSFNMDYVKNNTVPDLATKPDAGNKEMLTDNTGKIPMDIGLMNAPNTYVSITGPDGQSVKVSSKFSNLIQYFKGTNPDTVENIDIIISESAKWRSTIAGWKDKMANNAVAPSLGNFMDIIELSKVLENKK